MKDVWMTKFYNLSSIMNRYKKPINKKNFLISNLIMPICFLIIRNITILYYAIHKHKRKRSWKIGKYIYIYITRNKIHTLA